MANAYGSKEYIEYVNDSLKQLGSVVEEFSYTNYYKNFEFKVKSFNMRINNNHIIHKFDMSIYQDSQLIKSYHCLDEDSPLLPLAYSYHDNDYILFRKSLYGYTILNLNTMDEYNYFPSIVFLEKEAFIIVNGVQFKKILILEGCYWGCPYIYVLLDLETKKVCFICNELGIVKSVDNGIKVKENTVEITGKTLDNQKVKYEFSQQELMEYLNQSNLFDLYEEY